MQTVSKVTKNAGINKIFKMFLNEICHAHHGCVYLIKKKEKYNKIVICYYNLKPLFAI